MAGSRALFGIVTVFGLLGAIEAAADSNQARPNVVMFAVDDLRPLLGCYGDQTVISPHIDALASRGIVFERAYCQYAKCGPSRLSLMTGLRPEEVGVFSHKTQDVVAFRESRPDLDSLPHWFKRHGYHTLSFGKIYHDGWDDPRDWSVPSRPGREREMWEIADEQAIEGVPFAKRGEVETLIAARLDCPAIQAPEVPDDALFAGRMTDEVVEAIEARNRDADPKPLFLAVGYRRPHLPFVAPKSWFDRYVPDEAWLPPPDRRHPPEGAPILGWFNSDGYVGTARNQGLAMPNPPKTVEEGIAWAGYELRSYVGLPNRGPLSKADQLAVHHAYRACVSYIDAQVGRVLEAIETNGFAKNTIVLLWSDHGWHLGEHSVWSKMTNYEIATRVPLIIAAPGEGMMQGQSSRSLVELVDLYPTLCDLADLPAPEHLQGESLVPILEEPGAVVKERAISQYRRYGARYVGRAVRTDRYRFVEWRERKSGDLVARELYDHEVDPGETQNLANVPESAAVIEKIRSEK